MNPHLKICNVKAVLRCARHTGWYPELVFPIVVFLIVVIQAVVFQTVVLLTVELLVEVFLTTIFDVFLIVLNLYI